MKDWMEINIQARCYARAAGAERVKPITLSAGNTAIVAMHVSSNEFTCETDVRDYWDDWSRRSNEVTYKHIAPLFEAARSIGMRIMYVCAGWRARERYPQYREIAARVSTPPSSAGQPVPEWKKLLTNDSLGSGYSVVGGGSDIAPVVAAHPEDWVVDQTAQASTLFRENGIWNVLFVGFDAAGCVLTSPGGLLPMRSLGYRCFLLEDCVEAAETPETRKRKELKRAVLQSMQFGGYCYIASGNDIVHSIRDARSMAKS